MKRNLSLTELQKLSQPAWRNNITAYKVVEMDSLIQTLIEMEEMYSDVFFMDVTIKEYIDNASGHFVCFYGFKLDYSLN